MRAQVGAPQPHAAANVSTHQSGIKVIHGKERRTHGITAAGMQIRQADRRADMREPGGDAKLFERGVFKPHALAGKHAHLRCCVALLKRKLGSAHMNEIRTGEILRERAKTLRENMQSASR